MGKAHGNGSESNIFDQSRERADSEAQGLGWSNRQFLEALAREHHDKWP